MTEEDVRRIVLELKPCLDPNHIACERCSPGFNERARKAMEACDEWRRTAQLATLQPSAAPPPLEQPRE